jgi:plasmid stabilization system protein ParE
MKVLRSVRALEQLRVAHSHILQDNAAAARRFLDQAEKTSRLLADFPRIGVQTDMKAVFMFPLVRYRYMIVYRIHRDQEIQILRIRHGARRPPWNR